MRRRGFLAACVAAGVAGCRTEGGATDERGGGDSGGSTAEPNPTPTPTRSVASPTPTEQSTPTATASPTAAAGTTAAAFPDYETTEVTVTTPEGDELGAVTAAIADTRDLRYTGLSDTEALPGDRGMLFVYDEVDDHTYVMREMDFGLDIVYADDEGVITRIHRAPEPGPDEDGENQRYPGRGQYVLEVNYEWTTERGVGAGDVLAFEL
jgi:uncharacterized membrane protein (UPF0127 family)